jgi:hypothetical protein
MIHCMGHFSGPVIIQVRKCYFILCSHRVSHDNLADIIELIPILVEITKVPIKRLELGPARDGDVEGFGSKKRFQVE